jgi:hypothetical protein
VLGAGPAPRHPGARPAPRRSAKVANPWCPESCRCASADCSATTAARPHEPRRPLSGHHGGKMRTRRRVSRCRRETDQSRSLSFTTLTWDTCSSPHPDSPPVGTEPIIAIRVSPQGRSGPHRGPRYRAGRSPAERLLRPYRGAYRDRPKLHRWCTPVHPRQYPRHRFPGRLHRHALRCTRQYLAFEGTGLLGREAEAPLKRGRGARRDVRDVASWPLLGREAEAPLKPWHARVPRCAYVSSPRQRSRGPVEAS